MRKLLLLVLLSFISCKQSPTDKAQASIKKYIQGNINDPKSYEPVRFGELKSDSTMVDEEPQYKNFDDSVSYAKDKINDSRNDYLQNRIGYETYLIQSQQWNKKVLYYLQQKIKWLNEYKPKPCGFVMMHVFRKKNSKGAVIIDSMAFRIDSNYNVKIKSYYYLLNDDKGADRFSN